MNELKTACIEWEKAVGSTGYGHFIENGKTIYAHRKAYELAYGAIPKGLLVRHKCDNRICINPDHLEIGTQRQNLQDWRDRHYQVCQRGHPMHGENLVFRRNGTRRCKECKKAVYRSWDARNPGRKNELAREYYHRHKDLQARVAKLEARVP